jgi:hypothetical protein
MHKLVEELALSGTGRGAKGSQGKGLASYSRGLPGGERGKEEKLA